MEHLHDELDEADLKFLQRFGQIEADKKDVDEADAEGVEEARNSDYARSHGEEMSDEGLDDFHGEGHVPDIGGEGGGSGGIDGLSGDGGGDAGNDHDNGVEGQGEGSEGESEGQGEGEHTQNQDAKGEGIDQKDKGRDESPDEGQGESEDDDDADGEGDEQGDGEGQQDERDEDDGETEGGQDGESEEGDDGESGSDEDDSEGEGEDSDESEGEQQEQREQNNEGGEGGDRPECDGDCEDSDGDGEECPYCKEKQERREQRENQRPEPIAVDMAGEPIYIGSEIASEADGMKIPEDGCEFVAVVMGLAFGWRDAMLDEDELSGRMLVVFRRDLIEGGYYVEGERERQGWGVASHLCVVLPEEERQQEHKHQQEMKILAYDANNEALVDGDVVRVILPGDMLPEDGLLTVRADSDADDSGQQYACVVPLNFEPDDDEMEITYDGKPAWEIPPDAVLDTVVKHVHQDEQEEPEEDFEFEAPPEDGERKPMTKTQQDRFHNLCERIFKKSGQTFGNTVESEEIGPDLPGGVWDGDEIAKVLEIRSRGVLYRISVSAERYE